jgi:hypothetical protein
VRRAFGRAARAAGRALPLTFLCDDAAFNCSLSIGLSPG